MRQTSLHHVFHRLPRRFRQYLPLLAFILLPATAAYAQGAYSCDFEDEADVSCWTEKRDDGGTGMSVATGGMNGGKALKVKGCEGSVFIFTEAISHAANDMQNIVRLMNINHKKELTQEIINEYK